MTSTHPSGYSPRDAKRIEARMDHAGQCAARALDMATRATTDEDASKYAESAIRFAKAASREAWLLGLV